MFATQVTGFATARSLWEKDVNCERIARAFLKRTNYRSRMCPRVRRKAMDEAWANRQAKGGLEDYEARAKAMCAKARKLQDEKNAEYDKLRNEKGNWRHCLSVDDDLEKNNLTNHCGTLICGECEAHACSLEGCESIACKKCYDEKFTQCADCDAEFCEAYDCEHYHKDHKECPGTRGYW